MASRAVFTYDEQRYHVGELKVREVEDLEGLLDCRYIDMQVLSRMTHKLALATVFLRRAHSEEETAAILAELAMDDFDRMWSLEDDDLPTAWGEGLPLAEGGHSTPMS